MDKETVLLMGIEDMILGVADEQQEVSRDNRTTPMKITARHFLLFVCYS